MENDDFEIITVEEIKETCYSYQLNTERTKIQENFNKLFQELEQENCDKENLEVNIAELVENLRYLEEKLHLWKEVRKNTIFHLREISLYLDSLYKKLEFTRVLGSSTGILGGSLTMIGGALAAWTVSPATPFLIAGAGLGVAGGFASGVVSIAETVLSSDQLRSAEVAIEVDNAATSELEVNVGRIRKDYNLKEAAKLLLSVGSLLKGTKGLINLLREGHNEKLIITTIEQVCLLIGEETSEQLTKLLLGSGSKVLSGAMTGVCGGITMLWDMYNLKQVLRRLVVGGQKNTKKIKLIADHLQYEFDSFSSEFKS